MLVLQDCGKFGLSTGNRSPENTEHDHWHEHFEENGGLVIGHLIRGNAEIVVKLRGSIPVGNHVEFTNSGRVKVSSITANLVSPVWRKMTIASNKDSMHYAPNQSLERTCTRLYVP